MSDEFVKQFKKYISSRDGKEEPFFLYFASQDLHVPRAPQPRFQGATKLGCRGDAMVQFNWSVGEIMPPLDELGLTARRDFSSDTGSVYDDGYQDGTTVLCSEEEVVRKYQPTALTNERFSWVGDIHIEEGGATPAGDVRADRLSEKCTSLQLGDWGYWDGRPLYPASDMITVLSGCAVRNANFLLNIAPDRHGEIPADQQEELLEIGQWLEQNGEGIYNTRGGPWQPLFGEYGFTYRDNKIYCHIYSGYRHRNDGTFTTHSIGERKVTGVRALASGKELEWMKNENGTITIQGVEYSASPTVAILEITLEEAL